MNYTKIILAALAIAAGSNAFAQTESSASAGLLGQRFISGSFLTEDFRKSGSLDNAFGGSVDANIPLTANLDFGLGYSYERLSDVFTAREQLISASLRPHFDVAQNTKLFADVVLGHAWYKETGTGYTDTDNVGFLAIGVGAQIAVGPKTALLARVAYNTLLEGGDEENMTYTVGANHWFTQKVGGLLSVTFDEDFSVIYQAGVTVRF